MQIDPTVYNRIWEADQNGLSVSVRDRQGNWENPEADVLLDHQTKAAGDKWRDLAAKPLFSHVDESAFDKPTYKALISLFDNYVVNYRDPEDFTPQENAEIDRFLDLVIDTKPMQLAYQYITEGLGKPMSIEKFKQELRIIWFEPYTNYYGGDAVYFASGFEHVFVGEGKFNPRSGPDWGKIGGYHNWVKFYLDESKGRVNFLGTQYKLPGVSEVLNPQVVTLQMTWTLDDMAGNPTAQLFKERGGFFVGLSPECDLALGTVAYYESVENLTVDNKRRVKIKEGRYDLVMYRETTIDNQRGKHIRSFFPILLGGDFEPLPRPGSTPVIRPISEVEANSGSIKIAAIQPNPDGSQLNEWLEIRNDTEEEIALDNWYLTDKVGRKYVLNGTLAAAETQRYQVRTSSPQSMQLGNSGGRVILYQPDGEIEASVFYRRVDKGETITF